MANRNRESWTTFIESPSSLARLLHLSGESAYKTAEVAFDADVRSFLSRLVDAEVEIPLLAAVHYMSRPHIIEYISVELPQLIRSLGHTATGVIEATNGGIRGRLLWQKTALARSQLRLAASSSIVERQERSSDLPENRLLKLYLADLEKQLGALTRSIGSGSLTTRFADLRQRADRMLREPYLRAIPLERRANHLMRQRAMRRREWRYHRLAEYQRDFEAVLDFSHSEALIRLVASGWLAPLNDDDLFEAYALLLTLDVLARELDFGDPVSFHLVRPGRGAVATYRRPADEITARVFFDQSPTEFYGAASMYTQVAALYKELSVAARRPDISITFERPDHEAHTVLLEAKRTTDGPYIRDSIYKVMAYLRDFDALWQGSTRSPKAILLLPDPISPVDRSAACASDVALCGGDDREFLSELLETALKAK